MTIELLIECPDCDLETLVLFAEGPPPELLPSSCECGREFSPDAYANDALGSFEFTSHD